MLLRTWMIIWKEFKQISRDPRLLVVVVMLPVVMLLVYGYAINLDVRHVRMVVFDQDHSQASRDLSGAFSRSEYFDIVGYAGSYDEVTEALDDGEAKLALVIPLGLETKLADGKVVPIQVLVDGSDSTTASTAIGYTGGILQQYGAKVTLEALHHAGFSGGGGWLPVENRARFWYNPELRSTNFLVPGLIAVILMVLSALLTSVTVVRERERGTLESLIVSPVRPIELMLGKLIPYIIIAFGDVLLIMGVSLFIFHIPLLGSPWLVLLISSFFLIAALSIGLLISTVAPTQQVAMMAAMMATQLPTVLLSGFIFPITSMPAVIRALTVIVPASHFIRILRAVFLKGSGFSHIWQPALMLLLLGIALLSLSAQRFKKKL